MKYSSQELARYNKNPFPLNGSFDFSSRITKDSDLLGVGKVSCTGTGQEVRDQVYLIKLKITGNLILEDAVSLKEVNYPLDISVDELVSFTETKDKDIIVLENNVLDLNELVWQYCYLSRPYSYTKHKEE